MKSIVILALLGLLDHTQAITVKRPFKLGEDTIDFDELSDAVPEEKEKVQVTFEELSQADNSMLAGFKNLLESAARNSFTGGSLN